MSQNETTDAREALVFNTTSALRGALDACLHQIGQMRGMFDDADGTIEETVKAGKEALEMENRERRLENALKEFADDYEATLRAHLSETDTDCRQGLARRRRHLLAARVLIGTVPLEPGRIVATAAIAARMKEDAAFHRHIQNCLNQRLAGDWGRLSEDDRRLNEEAAIIGDRIHSVYSLDPQDPQSDETLWIITEADRSVTTVLLPDDY